MSTRRRRKSPTASRGGCAVTGRRAGPGGHEREITSLINSFRFLTPAEATALKPRTIDVVTVQPGETVATMAQRMAVPDHGLEAFLMLNDRDPRPELRPGEKVKLIVR